VDATLWTIDRARVFGGERRSPRSITNAGTMMLAMTSTSVAAQVSSLTPGNFDPNGRPNEAHMARKQTPTNTNPTSAIWPRDRRTEAARAENMVSRKVTPNKAKSEILQKEPTGAGTSMVSQMWEA